MSEAAPEFRVAVLVSGQGRNLQALIEGCADGRIPARIVGVLSDRANAPALARAQASGIATQIVAREAHADRKSFDAALLAALDDWQPQLVVLAGFMRVLGAAFVQRYAGRLINIHPSLLPKHPGLHTHRRVLEADDALHGATVHFVTEALDGGPALIQGHVSVEADDTPESLAARVMQQVEIRILPQALRWLSRGELMLDGGVAKFCGRTLQQPLVLEDLEEDFR